jgi:hypothetical protein
MTRGRRPVRAIQLATRIAEKRGEVQHFRHGPGMICTFVIYIAGLVAHVRIKRMRHLRCTVQWLEREAADELAALRIIASSPAISRELWLCSPRGNFRFFRVCDDSLVELDRNGLPLQVQSPAKKQRRRAAPAQISEMADSPSIPAPASTPEVSVGEHTSPDHKVGETP